ncbi:hypothetical protein [Acidicapsa acidisoli]|uniref:hypothetical protein n=1 Tax=Acidicapsa acidisoli TaxID=1615681 RepID=UPI0021DF8D15|nr:hypothetical protein [Acidicapsa acidisoli]
MPTQIADIIVPEIFSAYVAENSLVSTALFQSGVLVRNNLMQQYLQAGAPSFTVPFWQDLPDTEANIGTDNPADVATPLKVTARDLIVRKSFVNQSWAQMDLANDLSGSNALERVQSRVSAYWARQWEFRLIASLLGVLYSNVANNNSDMVNDVSGATGTVTLPGTNVTVPANTFNGSAVIDTALTIGDRLSDMKAIACHSYIYGEMLKNNEIQYFKPSDNSMVIPTYKGMAVIVDDNLVTATAGVYVTILFGPGAVGFGLSEPVSGFGTEVYRYPSFGNGAGETALFSRWNLALHPLGMSWNDGTGANAVVGPSPVITDLSNAAHWTRAVSQRKSIPIAFLISK